MPRILDDQHVDGLLPPSAALADVRTAFGLLAAGEATDEPRRRSAAGTVTLNVMSAIAPTLDAALVKSYPVVRAGTNRGSVITVLVYSCASGELRGLLRADLLGRRRTAAASALATSVLARPESGTVCLLGTGFQAPAQVSALTEVLPQLRTVLVVGRDADRAASTANILRAAHPGLDVESGTSPEHAVPRADVVVTATGSAEPLFDGRLLRPGTHVNAVGSNHAARRELDRATFQRAAHVSVDSAAVARLECGDLLANGLDPAEASEFADVLAGRAAGRTDGDEITVFESHGLAIQDLVCAVRVLGAAAEAGVGTVT
ncbi:ornithine cyclodeaminase family protein [Prauserella cavernicola]|uniref:Ornithine cyclodeaminase family protein n=1 Tax=Prauserella cavernicola TaxID=2800127 RepID=A0A934QWQ7_9PSEU|nr:ornithine cyclodeaminase family protein [Prauserella cavernicola]MBK1787562.1 ornithine cyclodeaminase family protein [Prauserella cavernicola]